MLKRIRMMVWFFFFLAGSGTLAWAGSGQVVQLQGGKRYEIYVVQKGDTVSKIAERLLEDPRDWKSIIVPDRFVSTNPNLIYPGQLLLVPMSEEAIERIVEVERASEGQQGDKPSQEPSGRSIRSIAVARFSNSGDERFDWLGTGLADKMSSDVAKIIGRKGIDRELVEGIMQEKRMQASGLTEPSRTQELGKNLAADHIIAGKYRTQLKNIEIEAALLDAERGETVEAATVSGKLENIFELERLLLLKLLEKSVNVSDEARANLLGGEKTSIEAFEQISRGKSLLYLGRSREAREYYKKALETDPKYQAVLEDLKSSLSQADTLAILPFKNTSGQADLEWIGRGMAESLSTDLHKLTKLFLVERVQVEKALAETALGLTGAVNEMTAPKVGKMTGAGIVLIGSYQAASGQLRADMRLVDVVSGQVLLSESASGSIGNVFEVETRLAEKIADALHVNLTQDQKKAMMAGKPDIESFKRYILSQGGVEVAKKEQAKGPGRISTLALVNFDNGTRNPEYSWLGSAIPGSLSGELKSRSQVTLVERARIDKVLQEMKWALTGELSDAEAPQLGKLTGADAVLNGVYQVSGDTIRIDARIVKVETGEVLAGGQVSGPVKNLFAMEKQLAEDIVAAIDPQAAVARKEKQAAKSVQKSAEQALDDSETSLLARRAYKFQLASGQKDKIAFLLQKQKERTDQESLVRINNWLTTVRGSAPEAMGQIVTEGATNPHEGFLFTRQDLDKFQFVKDERDLCIESFEKKLTEKK